MDGNPVADIVLQPEALDGEVVTGGDDRVGQLVSTVEDRTLPADLQTAQRDPVDVDEQGFAIDARFDLDDIARHRAVEHRLDRLPRPDAVGQGRPMLSGRPAGDRPHPIAGQTGPREILNDRSPGRHPLGNGRFGRLIGQGVEEGDQVASLLLAEGELADLVVEVGQIETGPLAGAGGVEVDHLLQRPEATVMHVGCGQRDIAQCRNLEGVPVRFPAGNLAASGILRLTRQWRHTDHLEVGIGKGREPMACETAGLQ